MTATQLQASATVLGASQLSESALAAWQKADVLPAGLEALSPTHVQAHMFLAQPDPQSMIRARSWFSSSLAAKRDQAG